MRSTTRDRKANEKIAAATMLTTPAMVVARMMEMRTGSILRPFMPGPAFTASDFADQHGILQPLLQLCCIKTAPA